MDYSRRALWLAFSTQFIINLGYGIIVPILPHYAKDLGATATILGLLATTFSLISFIVSPIWGRLSDRIGRKPVLIIGLLGLSLSLPVMGLANAIWQLFVARILSGLMASAAGPTSMAMIADTTGPQERARGMGLLGAATGLGMICGPVVGAFLMLIALPVPFIAVAVAAFVNAALVFFLLPKQVGDAHSGSDLTANRMPSRDMLQELRHLKQSPIVFLLILVVLATLGLAQMESTAVLFAQVRFGASEIQLGLIFMLMGAVLGLTQVFLIGPVIQRFGETRALQIALGGSGVSFILFSMVFNFPLALAVTAFLGLVWGFFGPASNSLISKLTPSGEQGQVMGLVAAAQGLGSMTGPLLGGFLFDYLGIAWPFYFAGCLYLAVLGLSFFLFRKRDGDVKKGKNG